VDERFDAGTVILPMSQVPMSQRKCYQFWN